MFEDFSLGGKGILEMDTVSNTITQKGEEEILDARKDYYLKSKHGLPNPKH